MHVDSAVHMPPVIALINAAARVQTSGRSRRHRLASSAIYELQAIRVFLRARGFLLFPPLGASLFKASERQLVIGTAQMAAVVELQCRSHVWQQLLFRKTSRLALPKLFCAPYSFPSSCAAPPTPPHLGRDRYQSRVLSHSHRVRRRRRRRRQVRIKADSSSLLEGRSPHNNGCARRSAGRRLLMFAANDGSERRNGPRQQAAGARCSWK